LGQILDPRIGNGSGMALDMKQTIRDILTEEYGLSSADPTDGGSDEKTFDLFAIAKRARNDSADALQADEVDDYFEVTKKLDNSCKYVLFMVEDNRQYSVPNVEPPCS
jgi:hypothetical protein